MKLTEATRNFWSQIISYIVQSAITIIICFWAIGWNLASIIAFVSVIGFFWLLFDIKAKVLNSLPDSFECQLVVIADYPLLNFTWLQEQTEALESLGFTILVDYTVGNQSGFGRRLIHLEQYCYAEIITFFNANGESLVKKIVIVSDLDKDWCLSSINKAVDPKYDSISYGFWISPKSLRIYHPNLNLDELMQAHLQFRQQIINDLGIKILTDLSWEYFLQREQEAVVYRKQAVKRKPLLIAMIEVTLFELNPKSEWLGDYKKEAMKYKKMFVRH